MSVFKIFVFASCLALASPSAIPMWEFLSRGEKMSHLFNMFVKQVAEHCDNSDMPDCQKVLLVYGLTNLAKMEDDSLDKMDPYQRGANDIIWESMMHGSYKKKEKHDEHRDYYADAMEPSTSEGNSLGSQEEASTHVEKYTPSSRYIVGPMVVRVLPDGSPVPRDDPLPKDEDAEEFLAMRSQPVPSLDDLATNKRYHQRPNQRQQQSQRPEPTTVAPPRNANTEFLSLRDFDDSPAHQFASLHHEVVATRRDSKTSMKRSPKH